MFKSQYNTNTIIFSPDGQLLQLNFASKASDRGNLSLGIKSKNHAILLGVLKIEKTQQNKENRFLTFGNNISMIATGISKDAKFLNEIIKKKKYENEKSSNRFSQIPDIADFCSKTIGRNTYYNHSRPFGIRIIMIGYDSTGPVIFDFDINGDFQRKIYSAQGKGSNKILGYSEKIKNELENHSLDELIVQAIQIYIESQKDSEKKEFDEKSFVLSFIGKNSELVILKEKTVDFYLKMLQKKNFLSKNNCIESNYDFQDFESDKTSEWSAYDSDP